MSCCRTGGISSCIGSSDDRYVCRWEPDESREAHVRLCESLGVRFPRATHPPLTGSQMRYNVFAGAQLVALISFGASAWKLAPRERFIGWDALQRQRNLQLIVNNARFLILPWIQSKGLASKSSPCSRASSPSTGSRAMACAPCSWKPSSKPRVTAAPATRLPTGSTSDKPSDAARSRASRADHSHQRHLALSSTQGLPLAPRPVTSPYGFTEYLRVTRGLLSPKH